MVSDAEGMTSVYIKPTESACFKISCFDGGPITELLINSAWFLNCVNCFEVLFGGDSEKSFIEKQANIREPVQRKSNRFLK